MRDVEARRRFAALRKEPGAPPLFYSVIFLISFSFDFPVELL